MAPSEFYVRLQKGIVGGFAPPTPDAVYSVSKSNDQGHLLISAAVRPEGTPEVQNAAPKELKHDDDTGKLVSELESILKQIPTEQPPGSEDIYGLNTGIVWGSSDLEWANGGPAGCSGGTSTVKATEEDKKKFKRAVEIVEQLVNKA
ncbi:hypothetical protein DFP72DRAFT_918079 [Ephemerocybe angulata]|uniref:Uncharacterized protein n=1 Tax=Ephemerocybe angulata TaxID=980116 RepID=A0A8H6HLU0_9AGAR|nr:hypothetical protein DFP72DRAFT_918079 [Tulosesus angulatus]